MANYKFKTNIPKPTDEQISRHKDFKKLRGNYDTVTRPLYKTPLYKNKKIFLALLLIVLIAYLISEFLDEKKNEKQLKKMPDKHEVHT